MEQKTIKPVSVGGIAGGEKYIVYGIWILLFTRGILFKFCVDVNGLYGKVFAGANTKRR